SWGMGATSEARGGERHVGTGPRAAEARVLRTGLRALALGAQALGEAEERPAVLRVAAQILAVHRLGLGSAPGLQQGGAEGLAHREVPRRRLGGPMLVMR